MSARFFQDRIVTFKETDLYVAVSLEFDMVAEGKSLPQALSRLLKATMGYLKICVEDHIPDDSIYRSAPKKYQDMFNESQNIAEILMKKREKGILKSKEKKLVRKQTQAIFRTYDSNSLLNA